MSVKYSNLLQYLLEKGEEIRFEKGGKTLTQNHFFAAVLQYCSKSATTEVIDNKFDAKEVETVYFLVRDAVELEKSDDYIKVLTDTENSSFDGISFKLLIELSSKVAENKQASELSADVVIESIINSPTEEIKNILKSSKDKSDNTTLSSESIKKAQTSLNWLFGNQEKKSEEKKEEKSEK